MLIRQLAGRQPGKVVERQQIIGEVKAVQETRLNVSKASAMHDSSKAALKPPIS